MKSLIPMPERRCAVTPYWRPAHCLRPQLEQLRVRSLKITFSRPHRQIRQRSMPRWSRRRNRTVIRSREKPTLFWSPMSARPPKRRDRSTPAPHHIYALRAVSGKSHIASCVPDAVCPLCIHCCTGFRLQFRQPPPELFPSSLLKNLEAASVRFRTFIFLYMLRT